MTTAIKTWFVLLAFAGLLLACASCRITPSINMGVGFDYYGGGFHARPYGNVGFHGHP
jgi:hypothetical protein